MSRDDGRDLQHLRLFHSADHSCGYWPDRQARDLVLDPADPRLARAFPLALSWGFRRSGDLIYRPHCRECSACIAVRIDVRRFVPNRSQRRCLARNAGLRERIASAQREHRHFALYRRYLEQRHPGGGMSAHDAEEFDRFLIGGWGETRFLELYDAPGFGADGGDSAGGSHNDSRDDDSCDDDSCDDDRDADDLADNRSGHRDDGNEVSAVAGADREAGADSGLRAVAVTDLTGDALSAVYTFYDPAYEQRGLGTYAILRQIEWAKRAGLRHLYLGYWIEGHPKMDYKRRFGGLERFDGRRWVAMDGAA
jgi:arginine-tRNA-protein transferase